MTSAPTLSLDEFVALNEELAALTLAGVPLERGLFELGRDWQGRIGKAAEYLNTQLKAGRNLADILADADLNFPPAYRAAIVAGLKSGRVAAAFEGVAKGAARAAESRRLIGLAALYPLMVVGTAYCFAIFLFVKVFPPIFNSYEGLKLEPTTHLRVLNTLHHVNGWVTLAVPVFVTALILFFWGRSGRAVMLKDRGGELGASFLPSWRRIQQLCRLAFFADLLALLVEHDVPATDALRLAGDASGDAALASSAAALSDRLRSGETIQLRLPDANESKEKSRRKSTSSLPPLLTWLIASGQSRKAWSRSLRQAADSYRDRATRAAEWLAHGLPILLATVVGGTVTLVYAVVSFWPFVSLLNELAVP